MNILSHKQPEKELYSLYTNEEAFLQCLLEHIEDMIPLYYMHNNTTK